MCLTTKDPKPLIADKDIVCYKIFRRLPISNTLLTAFRHMRMQIGFTYSHSEQVPAYFRNGYYYVEEGYYHSFRSIGTILNSIYKVYAKWNTGVIVKCVIPKGSKYYIGMFDNDDNEYPSYASDSIKLIKEVKLNWFTELYHKIFDKC